MIITNGEAGRLAIHADLLRPIFASADDAPWARALLHSMLASEPTTPAAVAERCDASTDDAEQALRRMPNVERDGEAVVGFAGLSRTRTLHRVVLHTDAGDIERFGWCAWDTMFLPPLLRHDATVTTTCPVTEVPITLEVGADGSVTSTPATAVLTLPIGSGFAADDARHTFCCRARLLIDPAAAQEWAGRHPDAVLYGLDAAMTLGRLATSALAVPAAAA